MSLQFRDRFRAGAHVQNDLDGQARDDFRAAVLAATGAAPDTVEAGTLQRFSTNGRPNDTVGWCQLYADGQAGVFAKRLGGIVIVAEVE